MRYWVTGDQSVYSIPSVGWIQQVLSRQRQLFQVVLKVTVPSLALQDAQYKRKVQVFLLGNSHEGRGWIETFECCCLDAVNQNGTSSWRCVSIPSSRMWTRLERSSFLRFNWALQLQFQLIYIEGIVSLSQVITPSNYKHIRCFT